jgi:trigger factor
MKVSVQEISEIASKVHVELPQEKVSRQLERAYRQLNRTVKLRGFRPGKVPLAILKRHYADQVNHDVAIELVNETLMEALEQTEMQVVSQSDLDRGVLQEGEPFRYSFVVEVRPEVVVSDYQRIPAQRQRLLVTDQEVEAELELRRQANSFLETLEEPRPIQQGDHAVLDFKAFVEGKPLPDGEASGFHLEIGANRFHPEFESKLVGTSMGDQLEIEVTYPADYGNQNLAGKTATFQVVIKDTKEKVLPELDDDFAKDLGEYENLQELRHAVREELERKKKSQIDAEVEVQLTEELVKRNPFELPRSMVEQELQRMLDTIRYRLSARNLTLEQAGMDENTFRERNRDIAEKKVRKSILFDKLAAQEKFEITDEELDQGLHKAAEEAKQPYEKVRGFYQKSNLMEPYRQQLMEEKVMKFLQEQAEITEVDPRATDSAE